MSASAGDATPAVPRALLATAASLAVDVITAEIAAALERAEIAFILLKGPVYVDWLYGDGAARPYGDTDLLIAPGSLDAAGGVLRGLGFRYGGIADTPDIPLERGIAWARGSQAIDVHTTLVGAHCEEQQLWDRLAPCSEPFKVAGRHVLTLDEPARCCHLALHAAQHGPLLSHALEDLRRGLDVVDVTSWRQAAVIARDIEAVDAFAAGLRLLPAGETLAESLALPSRTSVEQALRLEHAMPVAMGLERLRTAPSLSARARLLRDELFPPRMRIRWQYPIASRGPAGLALGYVQRWAWLFTRLPSALRALRRAQRQAR
jgi:hypothetical protein